mmetsp:Transcript_14298/g.43206  ORF Transcript_14298/g.43206 Transcript_14298/m.43206 type:complete len:230 (+) Transcript_14298:384-1073(+)
MTLLQRQRQRCIKPPWMATPGPPGSSSRSSRSSDGRHRVSCQRSSLGLTAQWAVPGGISAAWPPAVTVSWRCPGRARWTSQGGTRICGRRCRVAPKPIWICVLGPFSWRMNCSSSWGGGSEAHVPAWTSTWSWHCCNAAQTCRWQTQGDAQHCTRWPRRPQMIMTPSRHFAYSPSCFDEGLGCGRLMQQAPRHCIWPREEELPRPSLLQQLPPQLLRWVTLTDKHRRRG